MDVHTFTKQAENVFCQKADGNYFLGEEGVLIVEFMQYGNTIASDVHCETVKLLCMSMQNKWRGMLTSGAVFLHNNARAHTATRTQTLLDYFKWMLFDHLLYSPDLAPGE
jgi:hypothetical protein